MFNPLIRNGSLLNGLIYIRPKLWDRDHVTNLNLDEICFPEVGFCQQK